METACIHCGAEHTLKETELGAHSKVQFRCSKCGKSTVVRVKYHANATVVMSPLPSFARAAPGGLSLQSQPEDPSLKLPAAAAGVLRIACAGSRRRGYCGGRSEDFPVSLPARSAPYLRQSERHGFDQWNVLR